MSHLELFQDVLNQEAQALLTAKSRISEDQIKQLAEIFQILLDTDGDLVFCGVGKSGLIGMKLAATFSSLGLSSYFLHPTEALHGDLGWDPLESTCRHASLSIL